MEQPRLTRFPIENAQVGSNIYAVENQDTHIDLDNSVVAGEAQVEADRQEMIRHALDKADEEIARFEDACARNPELPGCQDTTSRVPVYSVPLKPSDGEDLGLESRKLIHFSTRVDSVMLCVWRCSQLWTTRACVFVPSYSVQGI